MSQQSSLTTNMLQRTTPSKFWLAPLLFVNAGKQAQRAQPPAKFLWRGTFRCMPLHATPEPPDVTRSHPEPPEATPEPPEATQGHTPLHATRGQPRANRSQPKATRGPRGLPRATRATRGYPRGTKCGSEAPGCPQRPQRCAGRRAAACHSRAAAPFPLSTSARDSPRWPAPGHCHQVAGVPATGRMRQACAAVVALVE